MKELGKISFPEQYVPADESIVVDNSVAAVDINSFTLR